MADSSSLREGEKAHFEARLTLTDIPKQKVELIQRTDQVETKAATVVDSTQRNV
jgi:hypothetical protein